MALMTRVSFGGYIKDLTLAQTVVKLQQYIDLKAQYVLQNGEVPFVINPQVDGKFSVHFSYLKPDLPEAGLQVFNDQWKTIAQANAIVREATLISYYTTA